MSNYYQEHKEEIKAKYKKRYEIVSFKEAKQKRSREYGQELKVEVLSYYSNSSKPKCLWCGEDRLPCLSIDHVAGGGREDRKNLGVLGGGTRFYRFLKKAGFPEGYQTLCMNCQWYKRWINKEK